MKVFAVFTVAMLFAAVTVCAAPSSPPKLRPYTGIGLFVPQDTNSEHAGPLHLYAEPGLSRQGSLNPDKLSGYSWIFGTSPAVSPLIVMGRKGEWIRVVYDDAGREAWLNPARAGSYQSWEHFFKSQVASLLPGLQKKYLQLFQRPGGTVLASLTPRQFFKVLRIENDWAMVLSDQSSLGWLRWRDEDGRLLIGVSTLSAMVQP